MKNKEQAHNIYICIGLLILLGILLLTMLMMIPSTKPKQLVQRSPLEISGKLYKFEKRKIDIKCVLREIFNQFTANELQNFDHSYHYYDDKNIEPVEVRTRDGLILRAGYFNKDGIFILTLKRKD